MLYTRWMRVGLAVFSLGLTSRAALATFHLMQIEQVIAGVNGDLSAQAIQLRMRSLGQNLLSTGPSLVVHDAAGNNPITLIVFNSNVTNGTQGDRVLIVSPNFQNVVGPAANPDFVMTNTIPASYLPAGTLTFELAGTVYWRVSWGGAAYTGPGTVNIANDANGDANPAFAGPLPSTSLKALKFKFAAGAASVTSANDYQVTSGAAVFTNNARQSFTLCVPCDMNCDGTVNPFDINGFLAVLSGGPACSACAGDANGNGTANPFDINAFILCLQ